MLRNAKNLKGYAVIASDGDVGNVLQMHFDDESWTVRYLVVSTGTWMSQRQVLISPIALGGIDDGRKVIQVTLTRDQIRNSPPLDNTMPLTREYEIKYYEYYNWPVYWGQGGRWGAGLTPEQLMTVKPALPETPEGFRMSHDMHLRSTDDVKGYTIHARDGLFGQVDDFIVDTDTWAIRYMVIDAAKLWPGKEVLISPLWIDSISWNRREVVVDVLTATIKDAPAWNSSESISRDYEVKLFKHYVREEDLEAIRTGRRPVRA